MLIAVAGILLPASAQTVYEAEASVNTISGSADAAGCSPCSGGKNVQNIGGPGNGILQFNAVKASSPGNATVTVTYDNGASSAMKASATVNGKVLPAISFPATGSWAKLSTISFTAPLNAGNNTISFTGVKQSYVAEIDKISVAMAATSTPPPTQPSDPSAPTTPTQPTAPTPPPTTGSTVSLSSFGSAGQGGDDTQTIQSAINATAQNRQTLEIPAGTYNVQPLNIPNNASILLDAGATVQATSGYSSGQRMINVVNVSNVSIIGTPGKSNFSMRKSEYTSGEYRHCLDIEGANSVSVYGIGCNNSGGDGLYIGEGSQGYSSNITVKQSSFDNNRRQGFSLISGRNITIDGCSFTNTNGTAPESGIDIEPNSTSDQLQNISITNSKASGNHGEGLMVSIGNLNYSSAPISINVSQFASSSNAQSGYFMTNEHDNNVQGVAGTITVSNSSSNGEGAYGAVASYYDANSAALTFSGLSVTNANGGNTTYDGAAIGVKRGGGDQSLMGGVTFTGTSISGSNGKLSHYFSVEDYSGSGLHAISIGNWGSVSGVPSGNSMGVVNGQSVNSVNVQ